MPAIPFTKRFRQKYPRFTRVLLLLICFFGSLAVGFGYASWAMVCRAGRCPPVTTLQEYEPRQTSKVLARDGRFSYGYNLWGDASTTGPALDLQRGLGATVGVVGAIGSQWREMPASRVRVADRGLREGILLSLMSDRGARHRRRRGRGRRGAVVAG